MGCCGDCFACVGNTIYYIVNFLILIIGIGLLCAGTIVIVSWECTMQKLLYQFYIAIKFPTAQQVTEVGELAVNVNVMAIVLLSVGAFLVLLGLFAFMGMAPSLKFLQKISIFIFIIFTVILLGAAIFVLVFVCLPEKPDYLDFVGETMKLTMKNYKPTTGSTDPKYFSIEGAMIDMVQAGFHCCGATGWQDFGPNGIIDITKDTWNMTLWGGFVAEKITVPPTCCRTDDEIKKWPDGDKKENHPDVNVNNFPTGANIKRECYTTPPTAKLVHTVRNCPMAIYQMADTVQTEIIIICSVLIFLFFVIIIALFVKLCSREKKEEEEKPKKPAAQPQQQPVPAMAPMANPVPAIAYPTAQGGYGAYPGYPGYPGYPAYQPQPARK